MLAARAGKVILLQLGLGMLVCVIAAIAGGLVQAVSAMIGTGIAVTGSVLYARIAYAVEFAAPPVLMRAHFRAQAVKFLTTVVLFAGVFMGLKGINAVWLLAAFVAASAAYWVALVLIKK
ncbi:ATP synthase subunit I [Leeia aquatica]|uniref:ATP synthase subunit I n=1 Tax=Leeia aquatica TaxID=2725557 RepID=A0A847SH87_9NEIS|nr:ATP synthase subunit I [Leeia aquatica]NLR76648.1 hypothetical protein [Leeia aquatica]